MEKTDEIMDYTMFFKSVLAMDRAGIVICDLNHTILYMNPSALQHFHKVGKENLLGENLMNCHSKKSAEKIQKVVSWFSESKGNNMVFTYHNRMDNSDVYMVALRDDTGKLIGYYEKHESRTPETAEPYDFSYSLI